MFLFRNSNLKMGQKITFRLSLMCILINFRKKSKKLNWNFSGIFENYNDFPFYFHFSTFINI